MSTETERFLGIDSAPSEQHAVNPKTKWWLASILLPVASIALGVAIAIHTPTPGYAMFAWVIPIVYAVVIGGILSIISSALSFCNRESLAPLSLLFALPSLVFLTWLSYQLITYPRKEAERRKTEEVWRKAEDIREKELSTNSTRWHTEFKEHPELVVSDDFWTKHSASTDRSLHYGLLWALNDKSFVVTPEIKTYVLRHFPGDANAVLANGRSTKEELLTYATNTNYVYAVQEDAIDCLLRDPSYRATDEIKRLVMTNFWDKTGLLFGGNQFTKNELQELIQDPKTPAFIKKDAAMYIGMGAFKK